MTTDTVPKGASRRVAIDGVDVTVTGIAKGAGMIHPDMATMLAFIATDAPIAGAVLDAMTARARRRIVQPRDGRRRHVDQRQLRRRGDGPGARSRRSSIATIGGSPPIRRRAGGRRDRARAGDRARRRGRDQVHHHPRRRRRRRRRMPAHRVRHRAFAAREDGVLRLRPESRAHRLRDRQRGSARSRSVARCRSGSTTCWWSSAAAARACYREEDGPARDEAGRDRRARRPRPRQRAATVWTCDLSHEYVSINADYPIADAAGLAPPMTMT